LAPCGIPLHPTQLYSAGASFIIFVFLFLINKFGKFKNPGILFGLYFFCEGIARCVVEFWRSEYAEIVPTLGIFNAYQLISLVIAGAGGIFVLIRAAKNGK
jgi:phosphatidylglycerol:prolipoprotein diacylglycerol transferase